MRTRVLARPEPLLWSYLQMTRVDHWFKNAFVLLGVVLALLYRPASFVPAAWSSVGLALLAATTDVAPTWDRAFLLS